MIQLGGKELDPPATTCWARSSAPRARSASPPRRGCGRAAPETTKTLVSFFDSTQRGRPGVSQIVQAGVVPGAIEMMD
jgi:glycolate oxidase